MLKKEESAKIKSQSVCEGFHCVKTKTSTENFETTLSYYEAVSYTHLTLPTNREV